MVTKSVSVTATQDRFGNYKCSFPTVSGIYLHELDSSVLEIFEDIVKICKSTIGREKQITIYYGTKKDSTNKDIPFIIDRVFYKPGTEYIKCTKSYSDHCFERHNTDEDDCGSYGMDCRDSDTQGFIERTLDL